MYKNIRMLRPPTLPVLPLVFLSSTRPDENKDAALLEGIP